MFKVAYVSTVDGLKEARGLLKQIYDENPKHWPAGLTPEHFDGGLYLVREASTRRAVGFCGWQERDEVEALKHSQLKESGSRLEPQWDNWFKSLGCRHIKTGYYSIGILPEFRNNGFAKAALQKLISIKAAGVDRVKALIMSSNKPSLALADSLGVEKVVKQASSWYSSFWPRQEERSWAPEIAAGAAGASLPAASLHQHLYKDIPAIRSLLERTPVQSWKSFQKRVKPGDILFEGSLRQGDATTFGRLAHSGQGVNPYHAFMAGNRRYVFHGGGEHGYVDTMGRGLHPFVYDDFKPFDLAKPDFWNRMRKQWAKDNDLYKVHDSKLVDPKYRKKLWHRLGPAFADSKNDILLGTRFSGSQPPKVMSKEMLGIMDMMNARPYGTWKALTAGLGNVILPRFLRGLRIPGFQSKAKVCIPGTSSCGELPATLLQRLGRWKMMPSSTLPVDLLSSDKLKSYGMTIPNSKFSPTAARSQIMKALSTASRSRVGLGAAAMLGAGGVGAGLMAMRRFQEPALKW